MLEPLRRQQPQQYVNFQQHVARVLADRGLPVEQQGYGREPALRRVEDRRFREILRQLINQGILVQGLDSSNPQWPFLSLTEWGEEYVRGGGADVYDPDGYLAAVGETHPLDDVERRYLSQAAAAFRADPADATAVMLGGASEHLLVTLAEAIADADATRGRSRRHTSTARSRATDLAHRSGRETLACVSEGKGQVGSRLSERRDAPWSVGQVAAYPAAPVSAVSTRRVPAATFLLCARGRVRPPLQGRRCLFFRFGCDRRPYHQAASPR